MAEHPAVESIRRALTARGQATLSDDDAAFLDSFLADDVVWHGAGGSGGEARGKAEVVALWTAVATAGGGALTAGVSEVYSDGNHGAGIVQYSGGPGTGDVRQANLLHLKDGRATELWGIPTDAAIIEALAAGTPVPQHPNTATFLAAEEARQRSEFGPDDLATIRRFLGDEVRWYMGGQSTWAAVQPSSFDEVITKFRMFKTATNNTLFFDIHEVFADDAHAASFVTLTADHPRHPERHMNVREVNIFHLGPDSRVFEFWGIPTDEAERDAFWADDRTAEQRLDDAKRSLGLPALLSKKSTNGALTCLEVHLPPGTMLAPVHTHEIQDEASYMLEGELAFWLDGNITRAGPGTFLFKPKGVPHTIFNDGKVTGKFLEFCWPGGLDEYLEDMAAAMSSGGPPDFKLIAAIAEKHKIAQDFRSIQVLGEQYGVRQVGM